MMIKTGEKVQNNLTGKVYEVKRVQHEWIVLEGEDGGSEDHDREQPSECS